MEQKGTVTNAGGTGKHFSLFDLKLLAILAMVVDHAALNFVPDDSWLSLIMHFIGRLTGPIMFYAAVEGYHHTKNIKKYLSRLLLFAVVSYVPFILFMANGSIEQMKFIQLNVIYTIFMGVLAVTVRRRVKNPILKAVLILLLLTLAIPGDWGVLGFAVIMAFDFYYGNFKNQAFAYLILIIYQSGIIAMITNPVYQFMSQGTISQDFGFYKYMIRELGLFLPLIVLRFYNGTSGASKKWQKWIFYIFYPAHLLLISGIAFFLQKF